MNETLNDKLRELDALRSQIESFERIIEVLAPEMSDEWKDDTSIPDFSPKVIIEHLDTEEFEGRQRTFLPGNMSKEIKNMIIAYASSQLSEAIELLSEMLNADPE